MSMNSANQPAITLDLKKQRIRIHSNTLHLLENPAYIDLLINPDLKILAVRPSKDSYPFSHKITYNTQQDHELYSKVLLSQLRVLHPELEVRNSYRLYGKFIPEKQIILFEMNRMLQINGSIDEET